MSNYPDDWDTYWSTCKTCGDRSHASAPEPCSCYEAENAVWPDEADEAVTLPTLPLTLTQALEILHELLARDTEGQVTRVTVSAGRAIEGGDPYVTLNNDEAFAFLVAQGAEPSKWYGAELSQRHAELTFLGLEITAYEVRS